MAGLLGSQGQSHWTPHNWKVLNKVVNKLYTNIDQTLVNLLNGLLHCEIAGLQENIFHGRSPGMWPLKMDKPWFFSDKPEKNCFTKSPHIKVLLVNKIWFWWLCYHLRTVIRNPRRNVKLNMGRIKCKESTSFYALWCIN